MASERICKRCVMDATDPSIVFDKNGYCNYCSNIEERKVHEYFPNAQGKAKLDELMQKIKNDGIGKKFDCMVGVSGGIDSSYIVYLGYQYKLRMICIHVDDGFDTELAKKNMQDLCAAAKAELILVKPDEKQYADLTKCLFLARIPNLALVQDNMIIASLHDIAKKYDIGYSLSGANFAMESILQRGAEPINSGDKKHIIALHNRFGTEKIDKLRFSSMFENYIYQRYFSKTKSCYPLNYVEYNLDKVLGELQDFSGYTYYGGKHYESILTRFLQCYYLPEKYNFDKRKSHFSSMIMSDQMTREDALERLAKSPYTNDELKQFDFEFIANYLGMDMETFTTLLKQPACDHSEYPVSALNKLAPIARKLRKFLG